MKTLARSQADALAEQLELRLDCGICLACLSLVSMEIDEGERHAIVGTTRRMTPILWNEGLARNALAAVAAAAKLGIPYATEGLVDLELNQSHSVVARAVVARLGSLLAQWERTQFSVEGNALEDLVRSTPELN